MTKDSLIKYRQLFNETCVCMYIVCLYVCVMYVRVCKCVCVVQIAELKRAITVGRKKVKERRAVEEQLVQWQIEVRTALPSLLPPSSPCLTFTSAIQCNIFTFSLSSVLNPSCWRSMRSCVLWKRRWRHHTTLESVL